MNSEKKVRSEDIDSKENGDTVSGKDKVLEALDHWGKIVKHLARETSLDQSTVREHLRALRKEEKADFEVTFGQRFWRKT